MQLQGPDLCFLFIHVWNFNSLAPLPSWLQCFPSPLLVAVLYVVVCLGELNPFTGSIFQVIDSEINSAVIPKCFPCVWGRVIIVRSPGNLAWLYACHTGIKGRGRGGTGTGGPVALEGTDRRELRLQGLQHNGHIQLWKNAFRHPQSCEQSQKNSHETCVDESCGFDGFVQWVYLFFK